VKDANRSTRIDTDDGEPRDAPEAREEAPEARKDAQGPAQPGKAHRARPGSGEHQDNQRDLGVGPDHVTDEMRRDKRGTFP
jgi:hypothetical protein